MRFLTKIVGALVCSAAFFSCVHPAFALDIVVPGALSNTEGDSGNRLPFGLDNQVPIIPSLRYQQVYGASAFSGITGPNTITQIAFRVDQGETAFTSTLSNIRIDLSTTVRAVDGLSNTFADNVGANNMTVFNGALSLSSAGSTTGSPAPFDVVINLTTPFVYNPSAGNLLLDVRNFNGGVTRFLDSSTATNDAMSRVYALDVNSATANTEFPSDGLITQFRFPSAVTVPEPATFPLIVCGLLTVGGVVVRRSRRPTAL